MSLSVTKCKQVPLTLIIIICIEVEIQSLPINNGFSIKFNPTLIKEEPPKTLGTLFAKIPQLPSAKVTRDVLSKNIFSRSLELATGCSNQIAKILYPIQGSYYDGLNETNVRKRVNFINVPVLTNDAPNGSDYKILVVSAPYDVKLGKDEAKPMLVYIVFPFENTNDKVNIPTIYFVKKSDGKLDLKVREKVEPIFIIDNNRTVTGLKSRQISKFIKFKSKAKNRLDADSNS